MRVFYERLGSVFFGLERLGRMNIACLQCRCVGTDTLLHASLLPRRRISVALVLTFKSAGGGPKKEMFRPYNLLRSRTTVNGGLRFDHCHNTVLLTTDKPRTV